jgi:hypothetical protein
MTEIGVPAVNLYAMLSGIGDTLQSNAKLQQQKAFTADLVNAKRPDGSIDWGAVTDAAARHNVDLPTTLSILKLGQEQHKQDQELAASTSFRGMLGGIFGNGGGAAASPSSPASLPPGGSSIDPTSTPRAPVPSTPKVWGDKEAEDAGIYEKPAPTSSFGNSLSGQRPAAADIVQPPSAPSTSFTALDPKSPNYGQPATPPQPSGFQGIGIQHVPQLAAALANPRLPAGDRELAGKLLTRALDDAKEPDKIRTLNALKQASGYQGSILDLELAMRRASKSDTNVSIDQKGETEEAKASGKAAGERRAAMFNSANSATNNLASLTRVQTLLDQVDQGKLAPARMTVSAWAKSLGMNDDFAKGLGLDPKKVGDAQALQAMTNELVLGKIGAGGLPANNFSDADRQFLTDTLPKLGNDPRANKILIEAARRVNQSNIQRALDYQTWKENPANKGKGFEDFELSRARQVSQMDQFGDLRKQAQALVQSNAQTGTTSSGLKWSVQ